MKIPAIDEGETVEVLPSRTRSLAVCVTLEDAHNLAGTPRLCATVYAAPRSRKRS